MSKRTADLLALASLMALTAYFAWRFVDFSIPPFEDAAMLMRYADHLADGKGIVWNIGEPPVDGATDFLFMVVVAFLRHTGLSLELAVRLISIASHFSTVALIYIGMRKLQDSGILPAFLSAAFFTFGPGLFLAAAYFGTPFFTLAVVIAWLLAQRLMSPGESTIRGNLAFSLACLIAGLIRPEGVLISIFMLFAVSVVIPFRHFRQLALIFGATFLVLGGTYFIWRWHYFGYPLPNPYYKKGGGRLFASGLKGAFQNSIVPLSPFIPAFFLAIRRRSSLRKAIAFLIPIVGSIAMWVLLSDEMNFGGRFQYPIVAIGVLSWFPLVKTLRADLRLPTFELLNQMERLAIVLAGVFIVGAVFNQQISNSRKVTYSKDGKYDIAVMLSKYADRNYTMATTEAGLLPLYSRWRDIDTWGLNDQWIAHNGGLITNDYLNQKRPDIIMWHGEFSPLHALSPTLSENAWSRQVLTLQKYAEQNNYTLAAVFGVSPTDTHYYYVRSDLPDRNEIVKLIRSTNYVWYANGMQCKNYADPLPVER